MSQIQGDVEQDLVRLLPTTTADDELVHAAKNGSTEAFELLVLRYQRLVWGLAARFLGNSALARDVAQDVFLTFWSDLHLYRPQGTVRSYLATVTLNRCRNVARHERIRETKRKDVERHELLVPDSVKTPIHQLLEIERDLCVRSRLEKLPAKVRETIVLRYAFEMALEEIAEVTNMPLGTVKSHVSRGLKHLHRLCAKDGLWDA